MAKKIILISAAFWNMGETSLAVEIAKSLRKDMNVLFFSFGGEYEKVIEDENFKIINLVPNIDDKKTQHLYKIDRCEKFGSYFSYDEIQMQVNEELELFREIKPDAIITALNFSSYISARVAKIPLFSIGHSTWLCETAANKGMINIFNSDIKSINKIQVSLTKYLSRLYIKKIVNPYNHIMKDYGLEQFNGYEEWWSGDYTIMTEPKGFVNDLEILTDHYYTGAIFADLNGRVPFDIKAIKNQNIHKKFIYFGMGSSGILDKIKIIIEELSKLDDYIIITPMKKKIEEIGIKIPSNFIVSDWIPTKDVLPFMDAAVIHGGLGTVFSTIEAEVPFVSIPLHAEQELNADYCVKKGVALKIKPFKSVIKRKLKLYLNMITDNEEYKNNTILYANEIRNKKTLDGLSGFIENSINKYSGG